MLKLVYYPLVSITNCYQKSEVRIETLGGFVIKPLGIIWVDCRAHGETQIKGKFLVVNYTMKHGQCKKKNRSNIRLRIV